MKFVLSPPIPKPPRFFAVAANYRQHIRECGVRAPEARGVLVPQVFMKPCTTLIGHGEPLRLGPHAAAVDWEAELGVVVGKGGRDIRASKALNHVFGYTIVNDVSERRWNSRVKRRQKRERDEFFDWLAGKWCDGFGPCGPCVVTADEIPDPQNLRIRLRVNGRTVQDSNTRYMIHSVAELIAYLSTLTALLPGDLLATGTPDGTGMASGTFLKRGDVMEAEVERIGVLRTPVA